MSPSALAHRATPAHDRVAALLRTAVGDAHAAQAFSRLARIAATMLHAPSSVVSVRDAEAPALLRVRGAFGVPGPEPLRVMRVDEAPCHQVIAGRAELRVADLRAVGGLAAMPLMARLDVGAYLGVPLTSRDGTTLGALCVLDSVPHAWSDRDAQLLAELGEFAVGEIERVEELTRRRRAEEALQSRERLFRAVFDRASQFMAVCSPDGVLLDVNQSALDLAQVTLEEVVGQPFAQAPWWAWCSAQRAAVEAALGRSAVGKCTRCSLAYLTRAGERRPLDFAATPVHAEDGAVSFILVEGRELDALRPAPVRCADPTCAYADALAAAP
jgi:PAS domain S-box-containing protein